MGDTLSICTDRPSSAATAGKSAANRLTHRMVSGLQESPERGDVPGWVMITLMSAILVAGLLAIASPALADLFNQAMAKVGN